jgi:murein DD-endopeptidase MepM/ murein hydrolase activator NlpD
MAKEVLSRFLFYLRFTLSFLQIIGVKLYDFMQYIIGWTQEVWGKLARRIKASRNHYTVLIVPQKKNTVRKLSASSTVVRWVALGCVVVASAFAYVFYEYISVQRDESELTELRRISRTQKEQIRLLASKIGDFEKKMAGLREYDQKIRVMADMVRQPVKGQYRGMGGPSHEAARALTSESSTVQNISKNLDQLIQAAAQQEGSFREVLEFLEKKKSILARTPSIWPVEGWVTSSFGYRSSPFTGRKEFHTALDIASRSGKEVVSPADGIVSDVDLRSDVGNTVTIDHGNGLSTSYSHLLRANVVKGKIVKRGEVIGFVGNTGRSTGSHLHYSVYLNGVPVNPRRYLP